MKVLSDYANIVIMQMEKTGVQAENVNGNLLSCIW